MKYLCVCDGGNVRSHALAYVLHDLQGHEAIPVGRMRVSAETMAMMCAWAERIVLMQPHVMESIPAEYHAKVIVTDVGVDRFGIHIHPELFGMVKQAANWLESK